ncbi:hypothetical protein [Murdochiella massiliensis]|uniref:hypothetical protein n=1 Tax=Murdochiella massiliensis TaxID=1673723 RepID=UPI00096AD627|nr:hypothetical protein [Murdochiella massiliensis]
MARYRVVKYFNDLHDGEYAYYVGDAYPRDGVDVTDSRVKELLGDENLQGQPLIEKVKDEQPERSTRQGRKGAAVEKKK